MEIHWTSGQEQRLNEFNTPHADSVFETAEERDRCFASLMRENESNSRREICAMLDSPIRANLAQLEADLAAALISKGFTEVKTPTIISKSALEKMTITEDHPLYRQVFFIDKKRCLRPMLAPNLYVIMKNLRSVRKGPIRFFEIGSCFRKESHSSRHLEEFTMLNLVEMGPEGEPIDNLREHIATVMDTVGLDYELEREESDVYRETLDVTVDGIELASGAVGPHPLDPAHGIHEPWCGVGFGLERLLTLRSGANNIRRSGRSLVYLNGERMDL